MSTKVLVVDDSACARGLVRRTLSDADFVVVEASDGIDALERLQEHGDVALIVCDLNMPRMGGLELLETLRGVPKFRSVAVTMLAADSSVELVARAKAAGAVAWISKPFVARRLVELARSLTSKVHA